MSKITSLQDIEGTSTSTTSSMFSNLDQFIPQSNDEALISASELEALITEPKDCNMFYLKDWYIMSQDMVDKKVYGNKWVAIGGQQEIKTLEIISRLSNRTVQSADGNYYSLIGDSDICRMEIKLLEFDDGFPEDWKELIFLRLQGLVFDHAIRQNATIKRNLSIAVELPKFQTKSNTAILPVERVDATKDTPFTGHVQSPTLADNSPISKRKIPEMRDAQINENGTKSNKLRNTIAKTRPIKTVSKQSSRAKSSPKHKIVSAKSFKAGDLDLRSSTTQQSESVLEIEQSDLVDDGWPTFDLPSPPKVDSQAFITTKATIKSSPAKKFKLKKKISSKLAHDETKLDLGSPNQTIDSDEDLMSTNKKKIGRAIIIDEDLIVGTIESAYTSESIPTKTKLKAIARKRVKKSVESFIGMPNYNHLLKLDESLVKGIPRLDPNTTRSGRSTMRPCEYWRNEKPVF